MFWPIRSLIAGVAGTAVLSASYEVDRRLAKPGKGPLDYDDSLVPGKIACTILDLRHVSARDEKELGLAVRWSYGPAFALAHGLLRRRIAEPWASCTFFAALMSMTLTMFPLLGRTSPPWHWPRGYLLTSLGTHAAYTTAVALLDDKLR